MPTAAVFIDAQIVNIQSFYIVHSARIGALKDAKRIAEKPLALNSGKNRRAFILHDCLKLRIRILFCARLEQIGPCIRMNLIYLKEQPVKLRDIPCLRAAYQHKTISC